MKIRTIVASINFIIGLFSLFFIPKIGLFTLSNVVFLSCFFIILLLMIVNLRIIKINLKSFIKYLLIIIFINFTIIGAINSWDIQHGVLSSIMFFNILTAVFLSYLFNKYFYIYFFKGFIYSAFLSALWVILDFIFFNYNGYSINEFIFPQNLLDVNHKITFVLNYNGILLYKPAGFSWDPGMSITAIVVAFILVDQNIIKLKFKKLFMFIYMIAVIISLSFTSIFSLVIYLLVKLFFKETNFTFNKLKISSLGLITIFSFLLLLIVSFSVDLGKATNAIEGGKLTHLKYLSGIEYYFDGKLINIFFGYGFRGIGEFYNQYVSWFEGHFLKGQNPENVLILFFIWRGYYRSYNYDNIVYILFYETKI